MTAWKSLSVRCQKYQNFNFTKNSVKFKIKMATGYTLQEVEEKKPDGFFPKLFQNVCTQMGDANVDKMHELQNDPMGLMRYNFEKKFL